MSYHALNSFFPIYYWKNTIYYMFHIRFNLTLLNEPNLTLPNLTNFTHNPTNKKLLTFFSNRKGKTTFQSHNFFYHLFFE